MKVFLTILAILLIGTCLAISESACNFLALEPSNINRGIGYGSSGVVNIWHNSPFISYLNPAIASLHDGISYAYTRENWLKGSGYDDFYYDCGMINIGYKGIGIILPAPCDGEDYGINFNYGSQYQTDEIGNVIGTFNAYESAAVYGLSINAFDIIRRYNEHYPFWDHIDVAFGAERVFIKSYLGPGHGDSVDILKPKKAHCTNLGGIVKINYTMDDLIKLEGVSGISLFNAFNNQISYINEEYKDPIFRSTNMGLAFSISMLSNKLLKDIIPSELVFFDNVFSLRYLISSQNEDVVTFDNFMYALEYNKRYENNTSYGIEAGIFDTVFFRKGHYTDRDGSIKGDTKGFGINLHYKDIVSYTYNSSSIPGGDLVDNNLKSHDHTFMINLVGVYELVKQ